MRLLIPILILAGVLVAYFALRTSPDGSDSGTGPASSTSSPNDPRSVLDLARSADSSSSRTAAPAGAATTATAASGAQPGAGAGSSDLSHLMPAVPEPTFEGGVTTQPVGASASTEFEDGLALKYKDTSPLERSQALEALRGVYQVQLASPDKGEQMNLEWLKREMGWLETSLDQ